MQGGWTEWRRRVGQAKRERVPGKGKGPAGNSGLLWLDHAVLGREVSRTQIRKGHSYHMLNVWRGDGDGRESRGRSVLSAQK